MTVTMTITMAITTITIMTTTSITVIRFPFSHRDIVEVVYALVLL